MADTETVVNELKELSEKRDFAGAFRLVAQNQAVLGKNLKSSGIKDALVRSTSDRVILSFIEGAGFGVKPIDKALLSLEKLLSFEKGSLVLCSAWGIGKVREINYFYRRITVDFKTKPGHQFTYDAAVDMIARAPNDHILVMREIDRPGFDQLLKEKPGDFVKKVVLSYGGMSVQRLEDVCVKNGFVKADNWKKFWESARLELRRDKLVTIPVKRTEPIEVLTKAEDYGGAWLSALTDETDPQLILAHVREFIAEKRFETASEDERAKIGERLAFAITAARNVDNALYARLAILTYQLKYTTPPIETMRAYLWDRRHYIKAAAALPAREVGAMIAFLASDDEAKARLYAAIPELCYTAVNEIVTQFGGEESCRQAIANYMREPSAPATLTTLLVGSFEKFATWKELPEFITLLSHAIALGEGRQGGETLKMQNIIRRLFSNNDWLKKVFANLDENMQALFFERFQASIAWDPSTHHTIVIRMTHLVPALEKHIVKAEKKREYARQTSFRSFAMKKAEYLKLINEDMPANIRRIEFAKGFGDLSENAEYQYAKDEQRALMQKQTLMQADLEAVKPFDFKNIDLDEVVPGVAVVVSTEQGERTYSILGEWDNDIDLGILSFKTKLASNMLGKKVGDQFELPSAEDTGVKFGTIREIRELSPTIREWMKLPEGMQI